MLGKAKEKAWCGIVLWEDGRERWSGNEGIDIDPFVSGDIEGKREGQRTQKIVDREPYSRTLDIKMIWIEPETEEP